eukprot:6456400-Amphidinium_carterae.1
MQRLVSREVLGARKSSLGDNVQAAIVCDSAPLGPGVFVSEIDNDDFIIVGDLGQATACELQPAAPTVQPPLPLAASPLSCAASSTRRPQPASSTRVPLPVLLSEVCSLPCGDVYIIWCVPGAEQDLSGIHYGQSIWWLLSACIPGGQYRSGIDRLRALPFAHNPRSETQVVKSSFHLVVVATPIFSMATSSRVEESVASQWQAAVQEGHRNLRVADRLLGRSWVAPCPLPVEGASAAGGAEESEQYMELVVVALHWSAGPDGPPTSALVAIPEVASHGVQGATPISIECYYSDGQFADQASIVVVVVLAEYLARILGESVPGSSEVITFVTDVIGAVPLGSSVLAALPLPDVLQQGSWLHHDENAGLRYTAAGTTGEDVFVSAAEDDLPVSPSLLLSEILPAHPQQG